MIADLIKDQERHRKHHDCCKVCKDAIYKAQSLYRNF